jgi:hypothetical protein
MMMTSALLFGADTVVGATAVGATAVVGELEVAVTPSSSSQPESIRAAKADIAAFFKK